MAKTEAKTPLWARLLALVAIAAAAGGAGVLLGQYLGGNGERDTRATLFVTPEDDVVLMSAGIADIKEERNAPKLFGWFQVPGNERAKFIRYEFTAKLGIDGGEVAIDDVGDSAYVVRIPEFVGLGFSDLDSSVATETAGLLSWATPEINEMEVLEEVLSDETLDEQIERLRPILEIQARTFYTNIILAVDPDAKVEFTFADGGTKVAG